MKTTRTLSRRKNRNRDAVAVELLQQLGRCVRLLDTLLDDDGHNYPLSQLHAQSARFLLDSLECEVPTAVLDAAFAGA
ncbi:MAG TPA: hypothetical protein VN688_00990 [Gemmataceae bacterium]|nr:hypothetical protein [Gemmataceae bacterium]